MRPRRAMVVALVVGVAHFVAAAAALRALFEGMGRGTGGPGALHAAVALLTFPLFYTPLPGLFGGRPYTGWWVAALNAILWALAAWALVRRRDRRARRAQEPGR